MESSIHDLLEWLAFHIFAYDCGMCNAKPGLRCASSARGTLQRAEKRYQENPTDTNKERLEAAHDQYNMTPTGIKELREKGEDEAALRYQARRDTVLGKESDPMPSDFSVKTDSERYIADHVVPELEFYLDEEEIPDHSNAGRDWVTLRDMEDPVMAGNNCHAATWYVVETLVESVGTEPDEEVYTVDMVFTNDTCHYAVKYTTSDGDDVIIDYTARQFSEDFPFPYVAQRETWEREIAKAAKQKYGIEYDPDNQPAYD